MSDLRLVTVEDVGSVFYDANGDDLGDSYWFRVVRDKDSDERYTCVECKLEVGTRLYWFSDILVDVDMIPQISLVEGDGKPFILPTFDPDDVDGDVYLDGKLIING